MSVLPEHIRSSIAQRQARRIRCAQAIEALLDEPRLEHDPAPFIQAATALANEDRCDLNGTPGIKAGLTIEVEAWHLLADILTTPPALGSEDQRRARQQLDTIKRTIRVQSTLIELAIPTTPSTPPLQALWDEYQQRYPDQQ